MPEFVLKNNYFEFNGKVKQQLLGAPILTKSAPPLDACIFMDKVETGFLESQKRKSMAWFLYIDGIIFISTPRKKKLQQLLEELIKIHPNINIEHGSSKKISFVDLYSSLSNRKFHTDRDIKATDCHRYVECTLFHPDHANKSLVYSHALCLGRPYLFEKNFEHHESSMRLWFLKEDTQRNSLIRKCPSSNLIFLGKSEPTKKVSP